MKNKKFTYFLGFLVVIVWGLIIYRVIAATGGDDDETVTPAANKISKEPYNDYNIPKDTTHLLLNYRDPFALKKQIDTPKLSAKKSVINKSSQPAAKPVFSWNFIKYSGYIRNPGSKNLIAVMSISGKAVMMKEGETAEQIKLIRNLQDSIKVVFNGKTAYIKMQHGAL